MDVEQLQDELLDWYRENRRDLPWRETDDPYEVLVAEIMLQQTQVSRVVPKWEAFLDQFPTVEDLAAASLGDVLELWDGLGYNNRAKYLKRAAEQVVDDFDGEFPQEPDELEQLQGVGEYTANAVASFAFNNGGPVFDTNVRRLLYRFHGAGGDDELKAFHETLFPAGKSRTWNNAVMELGAEVCVDGTPRCRECPWREDCTAFQRKNFETPDIQSQSSFEGSWRQYRAKVLKLLMDGSKQREELAAELELPDEYDLNDLLTELVDEDMVEETGDTYRLPC
ncbi:MAG: A/G-specific adenine glycosylase [Candidatus Nanohaloarchaea archaeon]|nr:A/G-specific adenine glycosylase [Candidatus Nanohaloarchaea archaeon]